MPSYTCVMPGTGAAGNDTRENFAKFLEDHVVDSMRYLWQEKGLDMHTFEEFTKNITWIDNNAAQQAWVDEKRFFFYKKGEITPNENLTLFTYTYYLALIVL